MRRVRSHLSFANVVSVIALFVAIGGGSAVALSGSNTVQSDDLGPGAQVKAADVAANAVNGQDVIDNSLGGVDINEASLTGNAHKLIYNDSANAGSTTTIATVGPYAIKGRCDLNFFAQTVTFQLIANGPAGSQDTLFSATANDSSDGGTHSSGGALVAGQDNVIAAATRQTSGYQRIGGTSMLTSGSTLVEVEFNAIADTRFVGGNTGSCFLAGTATRAT
jgi:hypothetical protein